MHEQPREKEAGDERLAWLAMALVAEGRPAAWHAAVRAAGGAGNLVAGSDAVMAAAGLAPAGMAALREARTAAAPRVLEDCRRLGIAMAVPGEQAFPADLGEIRDPPLVLFWKGRSPVGAGPAVAVVGARRASDYGERTARRLGRELAEAGVLVVSGLARGIDAAAHRGALETGLTAAVLAGGLDGVYPPEHRDLAGRIVAAGGFLLSEQPPGMRPRGWLFPFRNRLVTGLAQATVVVEAGARSGSLASARHALDQGREVFAVPGPVDSPTSLGTNGLLAQGAAPLLAVRDLGVVPSLAALLEEKSSKGLKRKIECRIADGSPEGRVLAAIRGGAATADQISNATRLDGSAVLALLTALELDGVVLREAHGRFRIAP